ncbi:hypothetical protein D3C87_1939790 [compost metagenome]
MKALGIAAAQGQRIYTITQKVYNDNPGIVTSALSAHSYDTENRVSAGLHQCHARSQPTGHQMELVHSSRKP